MNTSPAKSRNAHAVDKHPEQLSSDKKNERKQRVLKHGATALVGSIAQAVIVKDQDVFLVVQENGDIPLEGHHGFGLYYHDCRYLNGYRLRLANAEPDLLASTAEPGYMADLFLTNPDIRMSNGKLIRKEQIGIHWSRICDGESQVLCDEIRFENYTLDSIEFSVTFTFQSAFEDIFQVRGAEPEKRGRLYDPEWHEGILWFRYDGADGIFRSLAVHFSSTPEQAARSSATFHISLGARERHVLAISLQISETKDGTPRPRPRSFPSAKTIATRQQKASDEWMQKQTRIRSDSILLNNELERSLRDLAMLRSSIENQVFFAAGIPWFATLFGRDSLITAIQTLAFNPSVAEATLRLLARYQGKRVDEWRDEEPGKILHELRVGEMAHLDEVPQTPYYGSVDSTPLFLILVARHAAWVGNLELFQDLKKNVEAALKWIDDYGGLNHNGSVVYQSRSRHGLTNQGWKDSGDSIVNADGTLAKPPIALVEVQGYVYAAKMGIAELYERADDKETATKLRNQAAQLKERLNRDFWMEKERFMAIALEASGRAANVVSSNPGQALWTGIVDDDKAKAIVDRLMAPAMFSQWGIRTLAEGERRFNPIGYHLGTVWPHDNSLIAAGIRRYGFDAQFAHVFQGIFAAAMGFRFYRLPELFAGFNRQDYTAPVRYPVACHPQAWAAGTIPFFVENLLGLVPDAFESRLRIVRPMLPDMLNECDVEGLRVGQATVDLQFRRSPSGKVTVHTIRQDGDLQIVME